MPHNWLNSIQLNEQKWTNIRFFSLSSKSIGVNNPSIISSLAGNYQFMERRKRKTQRIKRKNHMHAICMKPQLNILNMEHETLNNLRLNLIAQIPNTQYTEPQFIYHTIFEIIIKINDLHWLRNPYGFICVCACQTRFSVWRSRWIYEYEKKIIYKSKSLTIV